MSTAQYFDSAGISIRFTDTGEGVPVILVHGYTGSVAMWEALIQDLSKHCRVIALDCRGHGLSGKPHDTEAYGLAMVTDVVRLMNHLNLATAHIVGYSMGAEIALKLTTEYPDRVLSLSMGGSGWSGENDYALYQGLSKSLGESASFGPMIRAMTPAGQSGPTDEEIAAMDTLLQGQDIAALTAVAQAMKGIINVTQAELSTVQVPVLGVAGEHDPERGNLEKMIGVAPKFSMNVLAGKDHMSAMTDPQHNQLIVDFITCQ
ncbi:MAG: alpha/beta hydrolase [Pseudomonadota bacterium]